MVVEPTRIASAARALAPALERALALGSDAVSQDLEALGLVEWDRQQLIGSAQRALGELRAQRFTPRAGVPVSILERRLQPLEALAFVWRALLSGREVSLRVEPNGCRAVPRLLGPFGDALAEQLDRRVLRIAGEHKVHEQASDGGVPIARSRIGLIQADADPELAAYVLAQACLRRSGTRPRALHWAVVSTAQALPDPTLERHLRRLWLGVRLGDVHDAGVFAGRVDEATAQTFDRMHTWLDDHPAAISIVTGGELLSEAPEAGPGFSALLGPALFRLAGTQPRADEVLARLDELHGPLLVLDYQRPEEAEDRLAQLARGRGAVRVGVAPRGFTPPRDHVQYSGAVLVERLAPGLPSPRP